MSDRSPETTERPRRGVPKNHLVRLHAAKRQHAARAVGRRQHNQPGISNAAMGSWLIMIRVRQRLSGRSLARCRGYVGHLSIFVGELTENQTLQAVAEPGGTVEVKSTQIILSERPVSPLLRMSYKTHTVLLREFGAVYRSRDRLGQKARGGGA